MNLCHSFWTITDIHFISGMHAELWNIGKLHKDQWPCDLWTAFIKTLNFTITFDPIEVLLSYSSCAFLVMKLINSYHKFWPSCSYICTLTPSFDLHILEINENATHVFSIYFKHGLVHQNCVFIRHLYFTYSVKISFFVLIDCQYALFKSTCSKASYLTPCNVPHEWFVFLHLALLADWVYYIFPTSRCRYVFSISKY